MTKKKKCNKSKQRVRSIGENMEVTLSFSKAEYAMLRRVADRKRKSIRSTMLRMFYETDYRQEVEKWL